MTLFILNSIVSLAIFFTTICRLQKTDKDTPVSVRLAFFILAIIGMTAFIEPIALKDEPEVITVVLLSGGALAQILLAMHWKEINLRFYSKKKNEPIDWPLV